jgi:hypothetical protein
MFEEAHRLAVQSIEQDPGNLQGFEMAASSLIALNQHDKARPYLEKQIQLLNLFEYRCSPIYFGQVLNLLSLREDLFLLGDAFSITYRKNIGSWNTSLDSAEKAAELTNRLAALKIFSAAKCTLDWLLQTYSCTDQTLITALRLSRLLITQNDLTTVRRIIDALGARSDSLISECYLFEIEALLRRDGGKRPHAFLQKLGIESRSKIEADIPRIKQLFDRGELSRETVERCMRSICDKYAEWKSAIETQLYDAIMLDARSQPVRTYAWLWGVLSLILLVGVAAVYLAFYGLQPETVGLLLPFGALFGAILTGSLSGRYIRRLQIYRATKGRLLTAFDRLNQLFAGLGLPAVTPRSPSGISPTLIFLVCGVAVVAYVAIWLTLMTRPLTTSRAVNRIVVPRPEVPLKMGVRHYNTPSRHVQTWGFGGGTGVDVQLVQANVEPKGIEVVFRVHAGDHGDLLLYEPPGSKHQRQNDTNFEELYVQDETGARFYSTTGLIGGRQSSFNNYNLIRRVNFGPREEVVLSARFPSISTKTSTITFVSPALNGWQNEWRWSPIALR